MEVTLTQPNSSQLQALFRLMASSYQLNGQPCTIEQVASPSGLLPALYKRADQLCQLLYDYGLGVTFEEAPLALLGKRVLQDNTTPALDRLLFLADVMQDLIDSHDNTTTVPLDELLYD